MSTKQTTILAAAALLGVLALCLTALLLWGPEDTQTRLVEAGAWLASSGAGVALLRWLGRDSDGDGTPDVFDADPDDPEAS